MKVVKIIPLFIITVITHCLAAINAQATGDNAYKVNFVSSSIQTNRAGRLVESNYSGRDVLRACAREHGFSSITNLQLVYDLDADAIQVVQVTDGAVLCTAMSFDGGQSISNANGSVVERLAFVFLSGDNEARGTARITMLLRKNSQSSMGWINRQGLTVRGSFQLATQPSEAFGATINSGFFTTGAKFVPTNPPSTDNGPT